MIEQEAVGDIETETDTWWAVGDMPVRRASRAAFLIDGRMTMLEICHHLLSAKRTIYITAWGLSPELLLVRGQHHRAGPNGSPEQEELLTWLRSKGLQDQDLLFWQTCEALSVKNVLSYAVSKGVDVRILLWNTYTLPFQPGPKQVQQVLEPLGVLCLLDDSHMNLLGHPIESHHQKSVVVDGRYAFVGGIDMMVNSNGEYDRWDTKGHPYYHPQRLNKGNIIPHSWHDVHVLFEGPAVADVEHNFRQRWNALIELHEMQPSLILPAPSNNTFPTAIGRDILVQVTRTIPNRNYAFAHGDGIATILATYQRAFANAQRFIYIENQYIWRRTYLGLENPLLGLPHPDMEKLLHTLADALARGVVVTLVLPDNPNVGREFTDDALQYLWEIAPQAVAAGTFQAYTLGSSFKEDEHTLYRSIYVHGKVAIVDDKWMTVGSANLNNRGMRDDTELNVAMMHARMAQGLRMLLMAEHLKLCDEDALFRIIDVLGRAQLTHELDYMGAELGEVWTKMQALLSDPFNGLTLFAKQAKENLLAVKESRPTTGHILPYISHNRSYEYGVEIHPINGWLDTLSKV